MSNSEPTAKSASRAFAIVPAAGVSRRMGRDKLLLPWGDGLLIDVVLDHWKDADVHAIVVVAHPHNAKLIARCRARDVEVVAPETPPPEMKDSVRLGIGHIRRCFQPCGDDLWLLAPADMPGISPEVIDRVISHARRSHDLIVVASHMGKKGHPAVFRWELAQEVDDLGEDEGVNKLFSRHAATQLECGPAATPADIDTPEDYERLQRGTRS